MEQTFYQFGVAYLRWEDKSGNIWEAVKEQVEILGKEAFEWDPCHEDYLSDCLISPSEDTLDYVDSFFEEHGHTTELQRWLEKNDFGLKSDWI